MPVARRQVSLGALFACCTLLFFATTRDGSSSTLKYLDIRTSITSSESGRRFPFFEQAAVTGEETTAAPLVTAIAKFELLNSKALPRSYNISLCAIATHEEEFLVEWITWHRLLGIERIYLFDNLPSTRMRRLLRPWLEEGSVVLYELNYPPDVLIGAHHRADLLRLCEREVLATSRWAAHIDVDEFLMIDTPGWKSHVPVPVEATSSGRKPSRWEFPLHRLLMENLKMATCVPVPRVTFANLGVREMGADEYVTERHVTRETKLPGRATYGKMFIQWPDASKPRPASWWGPHSCQPTNGDIAEANIIVDVKGQQLTPLHNIYPMKGLPLPDEMLGINHYAQRSLQNCLRKAEVVKDVHTDWRAIEGKKGCAGHYVPLDDELEEPQRSKILAQDVYGEELLERPAELSEEMVVDASAKESWQGRMTRAILDEWRRKSGTLSWPWEQRKWDVREANVNLIGIRKLNAPVRQGD